MYFGEIDKRVVAVVLYSFVVTVFGFFAIGVVYGTPDVEEHRCSGYEYKVPQDQFSKLDINVFDVGTICGHDGAVYFN
jgi:hypothetical protein|tara:strand:+ start:248 stop:481 length:234 start_codon:yes stop_codon:yes gene_type:complete